MTIDPFWAGVVSTLFVEMAVIFIMVIYTILKKRK